MVEASDIETFWRIHLQGSVIPSQIPKGLFYILGSFEENIIKRNIKNFLLIIVHSFLRVAFVPHFFY